MKSSDKCHIISLKYLNSGKKMRLLSSPTANVALEVFVRIKSQIKGNEHKNIREETKHFILQVTMQETFKGD